MNSRSEQRLGVILAGGTGSRLSPITKAVSKQLLPIYDKPMIYYAICVLILSGVREIVIITTPYDQQQNQRLLGNGEQWGLRFRYAIQEKAKGIAEAVIIAEQFAAERSLALILGDNFFFGAG
ncbi:MAG: NTP transferase domain-containing protein, partial [Sphingomonadaceae bacterium]|nr:NTP transferase domain-containing protein [Sphingomonadaceae bacterium]